jgi:hypothetical protein
MTPLRELFQLEQMLHDRGKRPEARVPTERWADLQRRRRAGSPVRCDFREPMSGNPPFQFQSAEARRAAATALIPINPALNFEQPESCRVVATESPVRMLAGKLAIPASR